ncbi:MAG: FHA domain-containing protein [Pseudomonadales bacterium]
MSGYFLIRGSDPEGTERIELAGEMIVGRSDASDIIVKDGHPSRRHARLTIENDALWLEDLESANGSFVNDRPVSGKIQLHGGDRIAFDLSTFVVAAPAVADADATVMRRPEVDPEATVMRPSPAAPPASAEPEVAAHPPPEPPQQPAAPQQPAPPPAAAGQQVPRSWADPEFQPDGTRMLSAEELRAMASGGGPGAAPKPGTAPGGEARGPHLRVLIGSAAGSILEFPPGPGEWSVGTDDARDLKLDDPGISAFHAKLSHDKGRWRVIDQMSANGTFVNDEKTTVSYLKDGDLIRFAQVQCEFRLPTGKGRKRSAKARGNGPTGSNSRAWLLMAAAAVATVAVLAAVNWLT